MAYRILEVDGVEHKYVIGRTHFKIRGMGAWPKEDFGAGIYATDQITLEQYKKYIITPGMIADVIRGKLDPTKRVNPIGYFDTCGHGDQKFGCDPLQLEIYDRIVYVCWCPECYENSRRAI